MNKLLLAALIASTALAIVTTKKATEAEYDRAQIKEAATTDWCNSLSDEQNINRCKYLAI